MAAVLSNPEGLKSTLCHREPGSLYSSSSACSPRVSAFQAIGWQLLLTWEETRIWGYFSLLSSTEQRVSKLGMDPADPRL